jgi:hypothetical protein
MPANLTKKSKDKDFTGMFEDDANEKVIYRICKKLKFMFKGHKLEIFCSGVFTQIRPVWVGDIGPRPKNSKF